VTFTLRDATFYSSTFPTYKAKTNATTPHREERVKCCETYRGEWGGGPVQKSGQPKSINSFANKIETKLTQNRENGVGWGGGGC
jgi:hypothetical protein